jgi:hypothetical protein
MDSFLTSVKNNFFNSSNIEINSTEYIEIAKRWFTSSTLNNIKGWETFPCVDATTGNTSYIDSFLTRYGIDGFQILDPYEYAYYTLMGKRGVTVDELEPNMPLIISLPNWYYGGLRPEWNNVLAVCESRNIDIHIDLAWLPLARDIELDLSHPAIKSVATGISKYTQNWARVGVRWSRQRTMDTITILNHYYSQNNSSLFTAGAYAMQHIPFDYNWNTYGDRYYDLCDVIGISPTNLINVVKDHTTNSAYGIATLLVK